MGFTVFTNDINETPYILAPGEILLFSQYGQLIVVNNNDDSTMVVPKDGKYIINFESDDDLPLSLVTRIVY